MTLTDKGYAEAIAALKQGAQVTTLYWCDGSTPCAIKAEPHGHWRGGYNVDAGEVMRRLLDENERLRAENERLRHVLADIRYWSKHDHVMRFDGADIPLADYCARALHGGK